MTTIIGAKCIDGVVLIADRKVTHHDGPDTYRDEIFSPYYPIAIAPAGNNDLIDKFIRKALEKAQIKYQTLNYFGLAGSLVTGQTTETNAQVTVNSAFTFSQLLANVASNGMTNASTLTLRANAGNAGSVSVSIGASSTGVFVDNTDTYTAATTDAMNYKLATASTGTSISISHLSVWGNISAATAGTTYKGQKFRNLPPLKMPAYTSFGSTNPIFG